MSLFLNIYDEENNPFTFRDNTENWTIPDVVTQELSNYYFRISNIDELNPEIKIEGDFYKTFLNFDKD
jgi:hypothetical protein